MATLKRAYVVILWLHDQDEIYQVHGPFPSKMNASVYVAKWFDKHGETVKGKIISYEIRRIIIGLFGGTNDVFYREAL